MGSQDQRAQPSCQDEPTSCLNDRFQLEPVLFQGSPLHHSPKGKRSINEFIHLCQAWVWSSCCVSDPAGGHGANSTQRSRPGGTSHPAAARERLAGGSLKPRAQGSLGAWWCGLLLLLPLLQFFPSAPIRRAAEQRYFTCILQRLRRDPWSSRSQCAGLFCTIKGLEETPITTALTLQVFWAYWLSSEEPLNPLQYGKTARNFLLRVLLNCLLSLCFFFVLFCLFLRNNIELRLKQKWTS